MTVADIKEFIRKRIVELGIPKDKDIYDFYRLKEITVAKSNDEKIDELENIYLMLDELESETKKNKEQVPQEKNNEAILLLSALWTFQKKISDKG